MKTTRDLIAYKSYIRKQFGIYPNIKVTKSTTLANCNGTFNRKAPCGFSWIDYWRAMSGSHITLLTCSSCGKIIHVGFVPKLMSNIYALSGDCEKRHIAVGGHVWVKTPTHSSYSGGRYITPLCIECNNKRGESITIRKGSILCKEVGASVK